MSLCDLPWVKSHLRYPDTGTPATAAAPLMRSSSASDNRTLTTLLTRNLSLFAAMSTSRSVRTVARLGIRKWTLVFPIERPRKLWYWRGVPLRYISPRGPR